jgi:phage terminase small subunit
VLFSCLFGIFIIGWGSNFLRSLSVIDQSSKVHLTFYCNRYETMASATKKLKVRRKLAQARMARRRKNNDRLHGSTAKNLPLNKPNAQERAVSAA